MPNGKNVVLIDSEFEDIVPTFIEKRKFELLQLRIKIENGDFYTAQVFGHRLKGNAGGYGFDELGELGSRLEIAAKEENTYGVVTSLDMIENYLFSVEPRFIRVSRVS